MSFEERFETCCIQSVPVTRFHWFKKYFVILHFLACKVQRYKCLHIRHKQTLNALKDITVRQQIKFKDINDATLLVKFLTFAVKVIS